MALSHINKMKQYYSHTSIYSLRHQQNNIYLSYLIHKFIFIIQFFLIILIRLSHLKSNIKLIFIYFNKYLQFSMIFFIYLIK